MSCFDISLDEVPLVRRGYEETRPPAGSPQHYYGFVRDAHDPRDYSFEIDSAHVLSQSVDLREYCPEVYKQGNMESCTADAVAGAFACMIMREKLPQFSPSRLFIWYNSRAKLGGAEGVKKNIGCPLRVTIQSLDQKANGVCSEQAWPFEEGDFDPETRVFDDGAKPAQKPPSAAVLEGHLHTAASIEYRRFKTEHRGDLAEELMQCLDKGTPFIFGMEHSDILYPLTSDNPTPKRPTEAQLKDDTRGHAMVAVGYDKAASHFIVRNSWGPNWCIEGYFYLPFDFLDICDDFWSIKVIVDRK